MCTHDQHAEYIKRTRATINGDTCIKTAHKELPVSTVVIYFTLFNDVHSISNKIETMHLNGIYTMEMLKYLVHMTMEINNEMKQPKNKNTALKS